MSGNQDTLYRGPPNAPSVLIVDDEVTVVSLLDEALRNEYRVATARSAGEAIEIIRQEAPHVLLLDKIMPGMSGLDLLTQVSGIDYQFETILMTAFATLDSAIEAMRLGVFDYLNKPFGDIAVIKEKIQKACKKREKVLSKQVKQRVIYQDGDVYRLLVEKAPDAIMLTDLKGTIIKANARAAHLVGLQDPEQLSGTVVFDLLVPEDRPLASQRRDRAIVQGSLQSVRFTAQRTDGSRFTLELSMNTLVDDDGAPTGFVAVARPVSSISDVSQTAKSEVDPAG